MTDTEDAPTPETAVDPVVTQEGNDPVAVEPIAPAEQPPAPPPEEEPGVSVTIVEDAGTAPSEPQPSAITMQPDSEEDIARAAALRAQVEEATKKPEVAEVPTNTIPVLDKTAAEIAAGRQRVAEHAGRSALQAAKEGSTEPEGARVAAATQQNKDL